MKVHYRRALGPDLKVLRECLWLTVRASPTLWQSASEAELRRREELLWRRWDPEISPAWLAEGQSPCGALVLQLNAEGAYRLSLAVHPQARRQGIATQLLRLARNFCQAQKTPLELLVDPENHNAIRLYLSLGFQPLGEEKQMLRMGWL